MSDHTSNVKLDVTQSWMAGFSTRYYVTTEPGQVQERIADAAKELSAKDGLSGLQMICWNRVAGFYAGIPDLTPAKPYNQIEVAFMAMCKTAPEILKSLAGMGIKDTPKLPFDPRLPIIFVVHETDAVIGGERGGNGPMITLIRNYINYNMNTAIPELEDNGDVRTDGNGDRILARGKRMIVFVSSGQQLGNYLPELKPTHVALPDNEALKGAVLGVFSPLAKKFKKDPKTGCKLPPDATIQAIATSITGMTFQEAEDAVSRAWQQVGSIEGDKFSNFVEVIEGEKARMIRGVPGLTYMPKSSLPTHSLPGYEIVNELLDDYLGVDFEKANKAKLPRLKGFLLVGAPGLGKTEFSKAVSRKTNRFALTLNLGAVQGGLVGQSEANMIRVLEIIRATEPIVLVDEVDKMGMGVAESGHTGDGGTYSRLIGMLHTEMTDPGNKAVYILTANNIVNDNGEPIIPGSMIRAGRIDERFFIQTPDEPIRTAIFKVRSNLHGMAFDSNDGLAQVANLTDGYAGAEIANMTERAVRHAIRTNRKDISTKYLIEFTKGFTPMAKQASFIERFERQAKACKEFTMVGRSRQEPATTTTGSKRQDRAV